MMGMSSRARRFSSSFHQPSLTPPAKAWASVAAMSDLTKWRHISSSKVRSSALTAAWLISVRLKLHRCLVFQRLKGLVHAQTQCFNREFK